MTPSPVYFCDTCKTFPETPQCPHCQRTTTCLTTTEELQSAWGWPEAVASPTHPDLEKFSWRCDKCSLIDHVERKYCGACGHTKFTLVPNPCGKPVAQMVAALPPVALKHDEGKLPLDLLPFEALEQVALVLQHGREKYDAHNWRKGFLYSRLIASVLRHIFAFARGEDRDPESQLLHTAHAICGLLFLTSFQVKPPPEPDRDDRIKTCDETPI